MRSKLRARHAARLGAEFTRMCIETRAVKPVHWGVCPQVVGRRILSVIPCVVLGIRIAAADPLAPIAPDAPAAPRSIVVPPASFGPSWDLDGTYLWLGPIGAASHIETQWDSTFGAEAALVVVHERDRLGAVGIDLGASRWTERGGGRVWLDGLAGTPLAGRMVGASLGPLVELSELSHPRLGASIGMWAFVGITPFARVGAVSGLGFFAELGIHIALPVLRR
ncbi:MAG TPA: hypothetical protein VFT22_37525 [Kofleriaceae bacterium]|nr:hypothetical protein [Kofleriaceae bacterium]